MAINTINPQVSAVILHSIVLPMARLTLLHDTLIGVDFLIGIQRTGMRIVTGYTRERKMFRVKQAIIMHILLFKTIQGINNGRIFARMAVPTHLRSSIDRHKNPHRISRVAIARAVTRFALDTFIYPSPLNTRAIILVPLRRITRCMAARTVKNFLLGIVPSYPFSRFPDSLIGKIILSKRICITGK